MLNRRTIVIRCTVAALLLCGATLPAFGGQGRVYTLAIIPSAPPVPLHTQWMPFVERLSRATGLTLHLKLFEQMAEFEREIWSGAPDFIFSSPIQLMVAHKSNGYIPLVRGAKPVSVGLFVRRDSPIRNIDDLTGKKVSFVGRKNLCGVFVRHMLDEHKDKLSVTHEYAGSTRNVILNVILGKSDAGAVFIPELARESEETRGRLREILTTPEIAPHPLSAHPRVPATAREAVTRAMLRIAETRDGQEMLKTLRLGAQIVVADYEKDYRALEEVDVEGLTNWGH